MQKALFITSQEEVHLLASLVLNKGGRNIFILPARSISESLDLLEEQSDFNLIYLGHKIVKDRDISELSKALVGISQDHKILLCGTNKALKDKNWAQYIHEYTPLLQVMSIILKTLGFTPQPKEQVHIPCLSLLEFSHYPANFFTNQNEMIFKLGDEVEIEDVYSLIEKGNEYLVAKISDIDEAVEKMRRVESKIQVRNSEDVKHHFKLANEYAEQILLNQNLKISKAYLKISLEAQDEMLRIIHDPKISIDDIRSLLLKDYKLYYKHVALTSIISCMVLDELYLSEASLKEKICLASQFQNITLENEKELVVFDRDHLNHFSSYEKKRLVNHADEAFKLIQSLPDFDGDVLKMVKEHHGDKRGIGYPEKMQSSLKLSMIFQIVSLFSQVFLIETERGLNPSALDVFNRVYQRLAIKDQSIIKALKSIVGTV